MEQLLLEAFAFQRSKGRGENERDHHKRFGHASIARDVLPSVVSLTRLKSAVRRVHDERIPDMVSLLCHELFNQESCHTRQQFQQSSGLLSTWEFDLISREIRGLEAVVNI